MLKRDLTLRNPLGMLGYNEETVLPQGGFGAVLARAGVGKTSMLVQLAIHAMLKGENVLHISLKDPVDKVTVWYKEMFQLLARQNKISQIAPLWESLLPHRFIMTFREDGFSLPRLEERLTDITEQKIFTPNMMIIDGLPFDADVSQILNALQAFSRERHLHAWFTVTTHRHEPPASGELPIQISPVSDLFDTIIQLRPEGKEIHIEALKGSSLEQPPVLLLDPSTMLISGKNAKE